MPKEEFIKSDGLYKVKTFRTTLSAVALVVAGIAILAALSGCLDSNPGTVVNPYADTHSPDFSKYATLKFNEKNCKEYANDVGLGMSPQEEWNLGCEKFGIEVVSADNPQNLQGGKPKSTTTPVATNTPTSASEVKHNSDDNGFDSGIYNQIINHPELVSNINYDGIKAFGLYYIGDDSKIITNQKYFKNQKSVSMAVVLEVQGGVDLKNYPKYVAVHNGLINTGEYKELMRVYIRDSGIEITPSKYETAISVKSEGLTTYAYIPSTFLKDAMYSGWDGSLVVNGGTCRPDSAGKEVCKFYWND